jgi:hypothetical protein
MLAGSVMCAVLAHAAPSFPLAIYAINAASAVSTGMRTQRLPSLIVGTIPAVTRSSRVWRHIDHRNAKSLRRIATT